jgi:beta-mannosidase
VRRSSYHQINNLPPDQNRAWIVNVSVDYLGQVPTGSSMQVRLYDVKNSTVANMLLSNVKTTSTSLGGRITGDMTVTTQVDMWWPAGDSNQTLYDMDIEILYEKITISAEINKRIGFRTSVLNQRLVSQDEIALGVAPGNKWNFQINGHDIYIKGSNLIPVDAFWTRATEERMRDLFTSVVDSVRIPMSRCQLY